MTMMFAEKVVITGFCVVNEKTSSLPEIVVQFFRKQHQKEVKDMKHSSFADRIHDKDVYDEFKTIQQFKRNMSLKF